MILTLNLDSNQQNSYIYTILAQTTRYIQFILPK
jgi:hypothetical protein